MATQPPLDPDSLYTSLGVGVLGLLGAITKASQWRDPVTGKTSLPLMFSGIAICLIMATVIRAAGVHFGIEDWAQVAASGVACYVGPDAILKAIAGMALDRFGLGGKPNAGVSPTPPAAVPPKPDA